MGRKRHIKMKIIDLKVGEHGNLGKCAIISVKIRYGMNEWVRPYAIPEESIKNFSFEGLKQKVYNDAQVLIKDKQMETGTLKQIEDVMNVDIILD